MAKPSEERMQQEAQELFAPRKKLRRSIYLLPSLFTVGNLFCGFFSIVSVINAEFGAAAIAIGVAVVLDGLDGRVARLANATSDFGLQLDSLADVISFGLAPALLIYSWGLSGLDDDFARFSAFVFVVSGATRLARYNVQSQNLGSFAGLPIPAGAGCIAAVVHFFGNPAPPELAAWGLPDQFLRTSFVVLTYLVSALMLSTLRYPSLKHLNLSRGHSHLNVLLLALLIASLYYASRPVLLAIATIYLLSGPVSRGYQFFRYRSSHQVYPLKSRLDS